MENLTELSRKQLRVIISYTCFNKGEHNDVISMIKALRDGYLVSGMSAIINAKYHKILEQNDITESINYIGNNRKKAICTMFVHILSLSEITDAMFASILNCLNICYNHMEGTDEVIASIYSDIVKICKSNKKVHDYIILTERWMAQTDNDWNSSSIDELLLIDAKTVKSRKSSKSDIKKN